MHVQVHVASPLLPEREKNDPLAAAPPQRVTFNC